jgi:UDP-hydrolysing UDP-N-acetyl-D-glucosamine 2-epimerase
MRRIAVVTGTRAEYGLMRWLIAELRAAPEVTLDVVATAAHLADEHGRTVQEIRADGITPLELPSLDAEDSRRGIARSIASVVRGLADAFTERRPDLLLLLGDRYETLGAAVGASALGIPIAHARGGELTLGAQDDAWRHAITKLSHLHFAATDGAAARIRQLGEEPWRIHVTGTPGLETATRAKLLTRNELEAQLGIGLRPPLIVMTYHPTTLDAMPLETQAAAVATALESVDATVVVTAPNADPGGRALRERFERFVAARPGRATFVASLGSERYYSLLAQGDAMVGNSSSGLVEAPLFELPVTNIGSRQDGRERAANVIDVACETGAIKAGLARALDPAFRATLRGLRNPYGDGTASARIAKILREADLGPRLLRKEFAAATVTP